MRKGIGSKKLNRTSNERKQLFRNLIREVVSHGFMVTTEAKAKAVKPQFEKLITTAKGDSLSAFRQLVASTGDVDTAKMLQKLGDLFKKRPGGYTRIIKLGRQAGDNTSSVRMELVEKLVTPKVVTPEIVSKPAAKVETKKEVSTSPKKRDVRKAK